MKFTIGKKILLGYTPILILVFIISLFTLFRLDQVNRINREIISVDLSVNRAAENLIDILLAQETYGQRYMILKSQEMMSLFWKRDQEFVSGYQKIKNLPVENRFPSLPLLEQHHADYNKFFENGIFYVDSLHSRNYAAVDSLRKKAFNKQIELLNDLAAESRKNQTEKTGAIAEIGRITFRSVFSISIFGIVLAIVIAAVITNNIRRSIKTLKGAASLVSQGKFKDLPMVKKMDELGDLSSAFNEMAARLVQLEELYMDSSPLTHLPGGVAIENAVKKRIESKEQFAFCMLDLDNFKPFNDRYGYSRGNAVIKNTAQIILDCSRELGTPSDFTGHIGGDDFVLITSTDAFVVVCNKIIEKFDAQILDFYNPEDRSAGFISSKNRQGKKLTFPIMTISIASMSSEKTIVENYIQVGEIIAELKKYAKSFKKSNLVIDRRGGFKKEKNQNEKEE